LMGKEKGDVIKDEESEYSVVGYSWNNLVSKQIICILITNATNGM
jgi:hypothetical protein